MGEIKGLHISPGIYTRITTAKKQVKRRSVITNNRIGNNTNIGNDFEKYCIIRPQITNVYSSTYKPIKSDVNGDSYNTCEKLYADILIYL